jgi:hypothetical protein
VKGTRPEGPHLQNFRNPDGEIIGELHYSKLRDHLSMSTMNRRNMMGMNGVRLSMFEAARANNG